MDDFNRERILRELDEADDATFKILMQNPVYAAVAQQEMEGTSSPMPGGEPRSVAEAGSQARADANKDTQYDIGVGDDPLKPDDQFTIGTPDDVPDGAAPHDGDNAAPDDYANNGGANWGGADDMQMFDSWMGEIGNFDKDIQDGMKDSFLKGGEQGQAAFNELKREGRSRGRAKAASVVSQVGTSQPETPAATPAPTNPQPPAAPSTPAPNPTPGTPTNAQLASAADRAMPKSPVPNVPQFTKDLYDRLKPKTARPTYGTQPVKPPSPFNGVPRK